MKRGFESSADTTLIPSPRPYSPILIIGVKWTWVADYALVALPRRKEPLVPSGRDGWVSSRTVVDMAINNNVSVHTKNKLVLVSLALQDFLRPRCSYWLPEIKKYVGRWSPIALYSRPLSWKEWTFLKVERGHTKTPSNVIVFQAPPFKKRK